MKNGGSATTRCSTCGFALSTGASFCARCGAPVTASGQISPPAAPVVGSGAARPHLDYISVAVVTAAILLGPSLLIVLGGNNVGIVHMPRMALTIVLGIALIGLSASVISFRGVHWVNKTVAVLGGLFNGLELAAMLGALMRIGSH